MHADEARLGYEHRVEGDLTKLGEGGLTYPAAMPDPASWTPVSLPKTWVDRLSLASPGDFFTFLGSPFRSVFRTPRAVELPTGVPGRASLPAYLLQEFHGMPNGYYSSTVASGYARGFEVVMLGRMRALRARMADRLVAAGRSVLDVGCGAGRLVEEVHGRGVTDIWGLDPCPYALDLAVARTPRARFAQGIAEATGFASERFDSLGVCFVLHELPRMAVGGALAEFRRVLRPGGTLVVTEPSPEHVRGSWVEMVRKHGLLGAYYKALAWLVFEPFLDDWLRVDFPAQLRESGFEIESDRIGVPFREIVARRLAA
jgi:ubiquinone/menaquinone biosynthesis C-methylase UbiE